LTTPTPTPWIADRGFRWLTLALGIGHLAFATAIGLRWEHLAADGFLVVLPWIGPKGLAAARAALPLWFTGVVVDNSRYLPLLGTIHTSDIWRLEMSMFRVGPITWPEWFNAHPVVALDFLCGLAYATYLPEFFVVGIIFYLAGDRQRFSALAWAFFAANMLGLLVYVFFPVAPPWYIIDHGLGPADPLAGGSAAGCARFDALLGIHYFSSFYSRNPNIFGAMPSLHVTYPVLVVWYAWSRGLKWRVPTVAFALWVTFSAVYLAHHYWIDVIAGALTAIPCALLGSRIAGLHAQAVQQKTSPGP
jgi:membrane-associated phospholipid phosphatase